MAAGCQEEHEKIYRKYQEKGRGEKNLGLKGKEQTWAVRNRGGRVFVKGYFTSSMGP